MTDLIERLLAQANCESPPVDDLLREAATALEAAQAEAWTRADHYNRETLARAFPDLLREYVQIAKERGV